MNGRWSPERKAFLVRDLVRDYCQVYEGLEEQRRRFDHEGAVSYSSIRDLLGEAMRKGVFWRLKDTAHHLFRNSQSQTPDKDAILLWQYSGSRHPDGLVSQQPVEALIDWCVGYAFHECAKLREDAFQRQHYANRLAQLGRHQGVTAELYDPLRQLGEQTAESSARACAAAWSVPAASLSGRAGGQHASGPLAGHGRGPGPCGLRRPV